MSESDDENIAGLSLEGLAQELESLRGSQRIVVAPQGEGCREVHR